MRKRRKRHHPEKICLKRILGEAYVQEKSSNGYRCTLNLSEVMGNLPMTINQDDIEIEARFCNGGLNLIVYCREWISSEEPGSGIYEIEEEIT